MRSRHREPSDLVWAYIVSGCVLLQNLSVSEARGKILHYQVTLQEVAGEKATLQNITEHTSWTWVIPRTKNWAVAVSAANSKGSSLPTCINITDLCGASKYQLFFNIPHGKPCLTHLLSSPGSVPGLVWVALEFRLWINSFQRLSFSLRLWINTWTNELTLLGFNFPVSKVGITSSNLEIIVRLNTETNI